MKRRGLSIEVDGATYDSFASGEVTRNLKDLAGTFSFEHRDGARALATFPYASPPALFMLRPGMSAKVYADGELVLDGFIKEVSPSIDPGMASVAISGEDKAGDLVDCAAAPDGPGEYKGVKLEEAAKRIAAPFGLSVKADVDTGAPFKRYPLDLAETGLSAIEKGARQRGVLVTSDGVGGVVITGTGKKRAPGRLKMPGNVIAASATFTEEGRHSEHVVRGQQEKAEQRRDERPAPMTPGSAPEAPGGRQDGDGSATERERRGTARTGRASDEEVKRHRPIVWLARSQADQTSAQDEADWRMRTSRGECEEANYTVHGFGVGGRLWRVNELVSVEDSFCDIFRDMLISAVVFREDEGGGRTTDITVTSPEAYEKGGSSGRRKNTGSRGSSGGSSGGGLDGTANPL